MTDAGRATDEFMDALKARDPHEKEFHQAVEDVVSAVMPWYLEQDDLRRAGVLERLAEPDRTISFRVAWEDDAGAVQMNRGWRVQFSHVLGPYKGGLRFAASVDQSVLKFLGFEQILKNSLTGLPMGGAKGGADFDPKGRSDREIARFCQSFMAELHRHIGPDIDVPAGDMGVGAEEISVLFGAYLRLTNTWHGALTGKGCTFGGSPVRLEATGYGCVYFCELMLGARDDTLEGKRVAISGSGNVALHAAEKAVERGAKVVTLSDSGGVVVREDGLRQDDFADIRRIKAGRGRLSELDGAGLDYRDGAKPWGVECDVAMPCATQNEVEEEDAATLLDGGVKAICEGANMPLTAEAAGRLREAGVLHGPGKASNAGGVAVSGFEQSQNAQRQSWSRDEVDRRLKEIMKGIHGRCLDMHDGDGAGEVDYVRCANLAGFRRVAQAMRSFGVF
ncbi:NADP-specific glutamate dehydrogenase [Tranquillimonas alkanivorans]|uniref:Glutamate dehydrogenase n=1 Tax=Tranquillimonas alkanivorans TaxID=441119 RepID=A0A1I5M4I0_9RHOB|nr:NADP-specific glutamate dehydrogenase [Tranquillimonas alkanivorans]SFP04472.1 glutamate dehydrogenase (NADP) [Tranquillimonas alkanivorans]